MAFTVIAIILLIISPLLYVVNIKADRVKAKYNEVEALFIIGLICGILSLILKALFGKDIEAFYNKQSADELDAEIEEAEETETNIDKNEGEQ